MTRSVQAHPSASRLAIAAILSLPVAATSCAPAPEAPDSQQPAELVIGGLDYAFDLPASIPSGPTEIVFENRGEVRHEVAMVKLKDGVTVATIASAIANDVDPQELIEGMVGILVALPGETPLGRLSLDLEPGATYGLVCNLTDSPGGSEDAPPHVALGMVRTFTTE